MLCTTRSKVQIMVDVNEDNGALKDLDLRGGTVHTVIWGSLSETSDESYTQKLTFSSPFKV